MSFIKNVTVEAMATHPGFVKVQMINDDGSVACETMMNLQNSQKVVKDFENSIDVATKLHRHLQSIIVRDSLAGKFGQDMQERAEKGGYEYNARLDKEQANG